jgi:hypothetical protein
LVTLDAALTAAARAHGDAKLVDDRALRREILLILRDDAAATHDTLMPDSRMQYKNKCSVPRCLGVS